MRAPGDRDGQRALADGMRRQALAQADERWKKCGVRSTVVPMRAGGVIVGWASLTQEEPERILARNPYGPAVVDYYGFDPVVEVRRRTTTTSTYNVARVDPAGPRMDPARPLLGRRSPEVTVLRSGERPLKRALAGGYIDPRAGRARSVHGRPR